MRFSEIIAEGYKIQLERDADMYVLHIKDNATGKRTEVRGKSGYESGNYDATDKLHQLLDKIGKSANISELINGEVVTINPKHPDATKAQKAADTAFNESLDKDLDDVADWMDTTPDKLEIDIVQEPIEKFMHQIREMHSTFDEYPEDAERTQRIVRVIKSGEKAMPIYVAKNDPHLFVMEGRHRMVAFMFLGMKKIPVAYVSVKNDVNEAAGVGRVVKGVNTTVDVGPNEIIKQVKKFGNDVDRDGKPQKRLK